jgi:hypothetical protein
MTWAGSIAPGGGTVTITNAAARHREDGAA